MDSIFPAPVQEVIQALGPVAGLYVAARVILGFQRSVVDGAMDRAATLDDRVAVMEKRIDELETEVNECDRRNAVLVRALTIAGIEIPPDASKGPTSA